MKISKIFMIAAVAMLFASCQKNFAPSEAEKVYNDVPVAFNADVCNLVRSEETTLDESFVLYFQTEGTEDARYNASNLEVANIDGVWQTVESLLWRDNTSLVNYIAYYPYVSYEFEEGETLWNTDIAIMYGVQPYQYTDETPRYNDLLVAKASGLTAENCEGKIDMTFRHINSKFNIDIELDEELAANCYINNIVIGNVYCYGALYLNEGEWLEGYQEEFGAEWMSDIVVYSWEDYTYYTAYMVPQTSAYTVNIYANVAGEERVFVYKSDALKFESGVEYTLPLTLGGVEVSAVQAGAIRACAWEDRGGSTLVTD